MAPAAVHRHAIRSFGKLGVAVSPADISLNQTDSLQPEHGNHLFNGVPYNGSDQPPQPRYCTYMQDVGSVMREWRHPGTSRFTPLTPVADTYGWRCHGNATRRPISLSAGEQLRVQTSSLWKVCMELPPSGHDYSQFAGFFASSTHAGDIPEGVSPNFCGARGTRRHAPSSTVRGTRSETSSCRTPRPRCRSLRRRMRSTDKGGALSGGPA